MRPDYGFLKGVFLGSALSIVLWMALVALGWKAFS